MFDLKQMNNPLLLKKMVEKTIDLGEKVLDKTQKRPVFMEVCGTHTVAFSRSGVRGLLEGIVDLRSGPGCPVCVTSQEDIDRVLEISRIKGVTLATFGDMLRVPGSSSSLEKERAMGADIRIIYSPLEAIKMAAENPKREIVLLGVGFETTAPAIAVTLQEARRKKVDNISVYSLHKTMPKALISLLEDKEFSIDALLLPGHVAAITGYRAFDFIASKYKIPAVVAGFEVFDIIAAISSLLNMLLKGESTIENLYSRIVTETGNIAAQKAVNEVFEQGDATWRGLGEIAGSGLLLKSLYCEFETLVRFPIKITEASPYASACRCGDLLMGKIMPFQCNLFRKVCTPNNPLGPCMVSAEGACSVHYRYDVSDGESGYGER